MVLEAMHNIALEAMHNIVLEGHIKIIGGGGGGGGWVIAPTATATTK